LRFRPAAGIALLSTQRTDVHRSGFHLLRTRRFGPLFLTQFLGAFNDNLYRTAMLFLIAYQVVHGDAAAAGTWAAVAGAVYVLPYFLFSSVAGELADRIDKARLARLLRAGDLAVMLVGAFALTAASVPLLMIVLFCTGTRGVFIGPLKFSILPQHLAPGELLGGTGLLQASGFLAVLGGQIAAGLLPYRVTASLLVVVAALALVSACAIPAASAPRPDLRIRRNLAAGMFDLARSAAGQKRLFGAILGISWFYALAALFTSQFPSLVANVIGARESVGALFLAAFSIGMAAGAIGVGRLLKGRISARFVPLSALALSLFTIDLWLATSGMSPGATRIGPAEFLARPASWRLLFDLFAIAASAGVFAVPLYAVLQTAGDASRRARDVAANNLVNAATVVAAALLAGTLFALGGSIPILFLALSLITLGVAAFAWRNSRAPRDRS